MKKEFSTNEIRTAKEVHLFDKDTLYVVDSDNEAYGFYRYGGEWYHKSNFWDYFESTTMLSYFSPITKDEAAELYDAWCEQLKTADDRLNRAICFATERHAGQTRKGTNIPYILHPLEVMQILYFMRADTELLIAGVLHDTVEDTDTTPDEIRELFGNDAADLVAESSEDKSRTWEERKQHTLDMLPSADFRVKQLILADKLSNLRSIAYDYRELGAKLWDRFHAPAEKQAWYYSGIDNALSSLQYSHCQDIYWEYVGLFKDVFVKYYLDEKLEILHQVCLSGEHYCLRRASPQLWLTYEDLMVAELSEKCAISINQSSTEHHFRGMHFSAENLKQLPRKQAERIEDEWLSR